MFKKLLNVGKGHSIDKLHNQQHSPGSPNQANSLQNQQFSKHQFQLNEIKSYGFSHHCSLGYSSSLSLIAVGSKSGLVRVLGQPSVEFNYQLECNNQIRQIEFVDCKINQQDSNKQSNNSGKSSKSSTNNNNKVTKNNQQQQIETDNNPAPKIVVLTDQGELHLLELKNVKRQSFSDNTTQTGATSDCCQKQKQQQQQAADQSDSAAFEFTQLEYVGCVDHFKSRPDDDNRSKRVTTFEISADSKTILIGSEGGSLYLVPIINFYKIADSPKQVPANNDSSNPNHTKQQPETENHIEAKPEDSAFSLSLEQQVNDVDANIEDLDSDNQSVPFETINFDTDIVAQLSDDIKLKKPGAIETIQQHPASCNKILISYHRGLSVIYDLMSKSLDKYFYHNQVLESSCFADQSGDIFYTSHNDGSYIKWDCRQGSQAKANEDSFSQLYGPYPCKPTPKIQVCTGLANDQLEELIIFSGGMPRATYDDKNPVTIVRVEQDGKDTIKTVLDFTSKVLDFAVITRPRGALGGSKSGQTAGGTSGGGKKNKQKQQQMQRNAPIAVALAILAEEEFVVIDLLNSDNYLEFALPYLNCVHSSAITCNQHYSNIDEHLHEKLLGYSKQQVVGKLSPNEWPITGGKVIDEPECKSRDILLTGHEDGSVNFWDVSNLYMRHLLYLPTAKLFSINDDDLIPIEGSTESPSKQAASEDPGLDKKVNINNINDSRNSSDDAWPPLKRVGRFDPYSDDTRLAIRMLTLCPHSGTMIVAGTGGQVLVFELNDEPTELASFTPKDINIVSDHRFVWKGHEKLTIRPVNHKQVPGYQMVSSLQINPPVAATSLDLRSDWHLFALGTSYGFVLYDYANQHSVLTRCTLNVNDFAIISGDAPGTMSRKKSFRKSLRESFRRLRRGRSQRHQAPSTASDQTNQMPKSTFSRPTTGVRTLNPVSSASSTPAPDVTHRNVFSGERQVEAKVELSSIVRCVSLTLAIITAGQPANFRPSLWVGTNSGQVLVYALTLADEDRETSTGQQQSQRSAATNDATQTPQSSTPTEKPLTTARLSKEIQLKHRAPIIAIYTSPEAAPQASCVMDAEQLVPLEKSPSFESSTGGSSADRKTPDPNDSTNSSSQQHSQSQAQRSPTSGHSGKISFVHKPIEQQPRVLICSEEQFKVFNLPNFKPFCKFKLTAHEGLRAKKIIITQFRRPDFLKTTTTTTTTSNSLTLKPSKSSQSFATQTSRPTTPNPVAANQESGSDATATLSALKSGENNNNSITTLNNNHSNANAKDLLSARFGSKTTTSPSTSQTSPNISGDLAGLVDSSADSTAVFEPYMVCMSNQGDCAIYSVPDLKRQAQIQVCKREDVNGITSTMLTNYGEGYYLKSSSNFLRFSISNERVPRILSVV